MAARSSTFTIWRTVVFAGATLATPACQRSKPAASTPAMSSPPQPGSPTARPRGTDGADCTAIHCGWATNHDGKTGPDADC